jgi:hypothetical protein
MTPVTSAKIVAHGTRPVGAPADGILAYPKSRVSSMALPNRQQGWIGLVVILLALVIVALSARTALKQYGLLDDADKAKAVAVKPGATEVEQASATTPRNALERARGVESMVKQQAIEQEKRIDDAIPK